MRSLRFRVVAATAAAAAIALVLALGAYAVTLQLVLDNTATSAATDQANQIASVLGQADADPTTTLGRIPSQGSILQLLDGSGKVLSYNDPAAAARPLASLRPGPGQTATVRVDGLADGEKDPYVVAAKGLEPRSGAAILMVASPLQTETSLIERATVVLGVLALLLLGALLWLIYRVLGSALGRVEAIRASVAQVRATHSPVRVPVPAGDDEITHLAETMNDMLERLHRADAVQRAFVSDASHELRSPLTAIRMISESAPEGIDPSATAVVAAEARRMQRLVEDLLTLAKVDDHGIGLRRQAVDLEDLLLDEVHRVRASTALVVVEDLSPARVLGDADRLSQIIRNLVDNASRHAVTSIRLACATSTDGTVTLTVDNDGEVVPVDRREAIFDRFSRLQQARDRDTGGSGLGLALVRALTQAHAGTVTAGVAPDGSCRFQVELPTHPSRRPEQEASQPPRPHPTR